MDPSLPEGENEPSAPTPATAERDERVDQDLQLAVDVLEGLVACLQALDHAELANLLTFLALLLQVVRASRRM